MPSEQKLSEILKEFAHTLLTDTPTQSSPRGSTFTMVLPTRGPTPAPTCPSRSDAERVSSSF
jgi:hypothetical protein